MKFLPWITRAVQKKNEKRDMLEVQGAGGLTNLSSIWNFLDGGGSRFNESGETINDYAAASISTVFCCVRILSDSVASLPCQIFRLNPTGKELDVDNWLLHLLTVESNPDTSAYSLFETLLVHLLLRGNGYIQVERNMAGEPMALWNLDPRKTEPVRLVNGQLAYKTSDGETAGHTRIVAAKDMLHVHQFSWDGIVGQSPIAMLRQTLGLAISQQKFSARSVANNSVPALVLTVPGKMKAEDKTKARTDWEEMNLGANQRRVSILDGGMGVETLGLSNDDQELLASRAFSRQEIAAAFRVPPNMVGDMTRLSNSNHEQQSLSFVTDSLTPILKRIEVEFKRKLLPPAPNGKPNTTVIMFDLRERLRGDFQSTMNAFGTGRQWGFYSVNDVRRELGEDTIGPEGDVYLTPVNMVNSDKTLETPPVQTQPVDNNPVQDQPIRTAHFLSITRDAVGRVCKRDKRDLGTVCQIFEPLVTAIAGAVAPDTTWDSSRAVAAFLTKLSDRAVTWTGDMDVIAADELRRATKALTLVAYRDTAEQRALKALETTA